MPDHTYTATIAGDTLDELNQNLRAMVDAMNQSPTGGLTPGVQPDGVAGGIAQAPVQEAQDAPKRRGRPPGSTVASQAAASGNGASPPAAKVSLPQMRQEATDILKQCWGLQPDGAERVVALQQKFGVKRFAEVGDDKIPQLHQMALSLQHELAGGAPAAEDTGPF